MYTAGGNQNPSNTTRHLTEGQLTPTRLHASVCFEAGEQEEVGPTALQAEGGRCASGGVRSAPSLTGPARLSVASKLSRVRALRSDHLSFPSALLAGRAMFRFFPPKLLGPSPSFSRLSGSPTSVIHPSGISLPTLCPTRRRHGRSACLLPCHLLSPSLMILSLAKLSRPGQPLPPTTSHIQHRLR